MTLQFNLDTAKTIDESGGQREELRPCKCPVCEGTGRLQVCSGTAMNIQPCHACVNGVVWPPRPIEDALREEIEGLNATIIHNAEIATADLLRVGDELLNVSKKLETMKEAWRIRNLFRPTNEQREIRLKADSIASPREGE